MLNLVKAGRWFFAICLMGLAGQQFYYSDFRPVFVPPWPGRVPGEAILTYLFSTALIGAALAIILEKKARTAMLILGGLFLVLLLLLPYPLRAGRGSSQQTYRRLEQCIQGTGICRRGFCCGGVFSRRPGCYSKKDSHYPTVGIIYSDGWSFLFDHHDRLWDRTLPVRRLCGYPGPRLDSRTSFLDISRRRGPHRGGPGHHFKDQA